MMKDLITKENIVEIIQSIVLFFLIIFSMYQHNSEMTIAFSSALFALTGVKIKK